MRKSIKVVAVLAAVGVICIITGVITVLVVRFNVTQCEMIYGVVLEESGTAVEKRSEIERSEGATFGNDSVRVADHIYAIRFRREDDGKIYTFQVLKLRYSKIDALALGIKPEEETRIGIRKWNFNDYLIGFVGRVNDDEIGIFGPSPEGK